MKKQLLIALLLGTAGLSAQTTHMVNWKMGVPASESTMTIETGDSVMWMWADTAPHSVTSATGSTETFDSGVQTGTDKSFTYMFDEEGATTYACSIHGAMMQGTITVEDAVMNVKDKNFEGFEFYPNPTTDVLTINSKAVIDNVSIYDVNGRQVFSAKANTATCKIYMDTFTAGTYLVKVTSGTATKTMTVLKK